MSIEIEGTCPLCPSARLDETIDRVNSALFWAAITLVGLIIIVVTLIRDGVTKVASLVIGQTDPED